MVNWKAIESVTASVACVTRVCDSGERRSPVIGSAIVAPAAHELGDIFHFISNICIVIQI